MDEQRAVQFLSEIRKPLLILHKAIIDSERATYEKEFGPVTPAAFLQVLINGAAFRWITPLSTMIANIDEVLDNPKVPATERIGAAEAIAALFTQQPANDFLPRYLLLLQSSAEILDAHRQVAQVLRGTGAS